jgi:hypothetical protein
MLSGTLQRRIGLVAVGLIAAASIGAHSAAAENVRHTRHACASQAYANHAYTNHAYTNHAHANHRHGPWFARGATLPYGPEYGFLRHVPPNAIVGPGYTFVPGVGILGASCDLPTSACTNEYRDVR